tara:strand:- start:576 stop:704 length:129 start_codon:yes stop_codon:yes gene_type:complete
VLNGSGKAGFVKLASFSGAIGSPSIPQPTILTKIKKLNSFFI